MKEKMMGKIKWYKENKGYGYIIGADDSTYFFEIMNCNNQNETFMPGDEVRFVPNYLYIEHATEVEKVVIINE